MNELIYREPTEWGEKTKKIVFASADEIVVSKNNYR
jgi:hypothetical protein